MPVEVLRCRSCESEYPAEANGICARCFGPLEPVYDWDEIARVVSRESIEAGPRSLWRYSALLPAEPPEDAVLIPGVITQSTVLVEHPELVAQRIERFARVVGRERVIAGADCGFATFAGSTEIHPRVAWAKLQALAEGARRASARLWPRG